MHYSSDEGMLIDSKGFLLKSHSCLLVRYFVYLSHIYFNKFNIWGKRGKLNHKLDLENSILALSTKVTECFVNTKLMVINM